MRKISSTFLYPSCPFGASVAALRTLLHGTGATLHSTEVPYLSTPNVGPMRKQDRSCIVSPPQKKILVSALAVPRMCANLLSPISTALAHIERERQEMKELGFACTAEITESRVRNSTELR